MIEFVKHAIGPVFIVLTGYIVLLAGAANGMPMSHFGDIITFHVSDHHCGRI